MAGEDHRSGILQGLYYNITHRPSYSEHLPSFLLPGRYTNTILQGTREFMPVEVLRDQLCWMPIDIVQPKYHYHIFHDLESLYWLLVWIVLSSEPMSNDLSTGNDIYKSWAHAFSVLFSPGDLMTGGATKLIFLSRDQNYFVWSAIIQGVGWRDHLIFQPIFDFRNAWESAYFALQRTPQDYNQVLWPTSCFTGDLYTQFSEMVTKIIEALPQDQVLVRSIRRKVAGYF